MLVSVGCPVDQNALSSVLIGSREARSYLPNAFIKATALRLFLSPCLESAHLFQQSLQVLGLEELCDRRTLNQDREGHDGEGHFGDHGSFRDLG